MIVQLDMFRSPYPSESESPSDRKPEISDDNTKSVAETSLERAKLIRNPNTGNTGNRNGLKLPSS